MQKITALEREKALAEQRSNEIKLKQYLLSLTDLESAALSSSHKYIRCRYLREIEANKFVNNIQRMVIATKKPVIEKIENRKITHDYKNFYK